MAPVLKRCRTTWPHGVVFWALVVVLVALSLDSDFNLEVPISQTSQGFKVAKESKENQGGQREVALAAAWHPSTPSFQPSFLRVVDQQGAPSPRRLRSAIIRAPPASASI